MAGRTRDVRLCATMLLGAMFVGVALLLVPVGGNVVTSIHRIKDMLVREEDILNSLQDLIASRSREKEEFTQFYNKRIQQIRSRNVTKTLRRLSHPNSIFSLIQTFADDYRPLRKISARWPKNAEAVLDKMANDEDVNGARLSLIRLQEMYGIKPRDMIKGNYLGHKGPSLTALDSFFVGRAAFDTKKYPESVEWFQAVLNLLKKSRGNRKDPASDPSSMGQIGSPEEDEELSSTDVLALKGRALLRMGEVSEAKSILIQLVASKASSDEMTWLRAELNSPPGQYKEKVEKHIVKFKRLCNLHKKTPTLTENPSLLCRYRDNVLPFWRYAEEVLSWDPYVSLFYDVITDDEADHIRGAAKDRLWDSGVMTDEGSSKIYDFRTSHLTFISDWETKVIATVSKRISELTGLKTEQSPLGYHKEVLNAAEPLQVVNYGLGGHYTAHIDPLPVYNKDTEVIIDCCGNRLATFLLYLTNVELGGSTAFPWLDIVVPPFKNGALFWYSYKPNGELDYSTLHASCPVVVGEKWVSNKWILNFGNAFARRCGLSWDATQREIDRDMIGGYTTGPRHSKTSRRATQKQANLSGRKASRRSYRKP